MERLYIYFVCVPYKSVTRYRKISLVSGRCRPW